jgi:dTDP-4-dehydrorhamnose 3,5-epimerase
METKIVRCIRGKVFDVVVDLRHNSDTFFNWYGIELSSENNRAIVIPEGCAHGFQTLENNSDLLYLHTASYTSSLERGIRFDDPLISIKWPLPPLNLSDRDLSFNFIDKKFMSFNL